MLNRDREGEEYPPFAVPDFSLDNDGDDDGNGDDDDDEVSPRRNRCMRDFLAEVSVGGVGGGVVESRGDCDDFFPPVVFISVPSSSSSESDESDASSPASNPNFFKTLKDTDMCKSSGSPSA